MNTGLKHIFKPLTILTTLGMLFTGCNSRPAEVVILRVEDRALSQTEFVHRYSKFLFESALADNWQSRSVFLNSTIDELLFLEWADTAHVLNTAEHLQKLQSMHDQVLLNHLYRHQVKDRILVSEPQLRELYRWWKTRIHTRHLYAPDYETAGKLHRRLLAGESWSQLAREVFNDPVLAGNGGDVGFMGLGDMEPAYEVAAYNLADGEISPPVPTQNGYSIIQAVEREIDPFLTEEEFQQRKSRLEKIAFNHQKGPAVQAFTDSLQKVLAIQFNQSGIESVWAQRQMVFKPALESRITGADQQVVQFSGESGGWPVAEVIHRLGRLSPVHRDRLRTRQDLEEAITGLVIQQRLMNMCHELQLMATDGFKNDLRHENNRYTIQQVLQHIYAGINMEDSRLADYYREHRDELVSGPRYELAEILLGSKQEAEDLRARLEAGAIFDSLAVRHSLRKQTGRREGYLGWGTLDQFGGLAPKLTDAVPGKLIGPVELAGLFVIIKVLNTEPQRPYSFDEAKPLILDRLRVQLNREAYHRFRQELLIQAAVTVDTFLVREYVLSEVDT